MATAKKKATPKQTEKAAKKGTSKTAIGTERVERAVELPILKTQWTSLNDIAKQLKCTPREARRSVRKAVADGRLKWEKVGVTYMVAAKSVKTKPPAPEPKAVKPKAEKKGNGKPGKASAKPAAKKTSAAKKPASKRATKKSDAGENGDSENSQDSGGEGDNGSDVLA